MEAPQTVLQELLSKDGSTETHYDAREWIEAWRATKEAYGAEFEKCEGLSRVPGIPVPEGMELGA